MSEQGGTRRILIADDDPERLKALVERLQREGFQVLTAQDGLEALDRAREELPDAIVLNLLLRRIDGLRVCEILKSNPATTNIPVLLIAGVHVDADEGKRALAAGADRFLSDLGPLSTGSGRELGAGQDLIQAVRTLLGAEPELELRQILVARLKDSNRYLMRQHAALRRADEEILQVNRQLEQSNRYKSEFLANMSHELRTPLNAILGFSEILLDLTMNLTPGERTEFLRNIHSSGQHLLGLINDILDLAKIEAGKMELHAQEMPVQEAIQEVTGILDPMARQQGLQVTTVGAAEAGVIKADRSKFKQGLYNLLSNALKVTPPP